MGLFVRLSAVLGALVVATLDPSAGHAQGRQLRQPSTAPAPNAAPVEDAGSPSNQARAFFLTGQEAYSRGDYAGAIAAWEQALALDARPQLHYNLAQAYGRVGRIEDELASLRRFLDAGTNDESTTESARARLASLERRLASTGIALVGDYPGARVVVDGQERGTMPLSSALAVRPGSHSVDVFLEEYEPFHGSVVVPAGETGTISVTMRRAQVVTPVSENEHPMRAPIALYASGGATLAAGATFGVLALTTAKDSITGSPEADRAHRFAIVSDVTLGAGAVLTVTGLVLHLLRRSDAEEEPASATVLPFVGVNSIGVAGTF